MYKGKLTLAYTGHRSGRLPKQDSELYLEMCSYIEAFTVKATTAGYCHFISGFAEGVDQIAAATVIHLQRELQHTDIDLVAAVPFPGQHKRWPQKWQAEYEDLLHYATWRETISPQYSEDVYHIRDQWMVDNADALCAVFDGNQKGGTWATMNMARAKGIPIYEIRLRKQNPKAPVNSIEARWIYNGRKGSDGR